MSKYFSLKDSGASFKQIFAFKDSHEQNLWNKIKESWKIAQDQKTLVSASA